MIDFHLVKQLNGPDGKFDLDVQARLKPGELLAVYGPSGAGKTTLLRLLAGLEQAEAGIIKVGEAVWWRPQCSNAFSVQQRSVGFLFQDYALFPHWDVLGNLQFALPKNQHPKIIEELIEVMELGDLRHQRPARLSGGQQQRVALARALVRRPQLLLLDEPLAAVDKALRSKLQFYLQRIHREYALTTIMVSHDRTEVIRLANRVLVLERGKVVRAGSPEEVFGVRESLTGTVLRVAGERALVLVGEQLVWVPRRLITEVPP